MKKKIIFKYFIANVLCSIRGNPLEFFGRILTTIYNQKKKVLRIGDEKTEKMKCYISVVLLV